MSDLDETQVEICTQSKADNIRRKCIDLCVVLSVLNIKSVDTKFLRELKHYWYKKLIWEKMDKKSA